jgi:hypothetical protein
MRPVRLAFLLALALAAPAAALDLPAGTEDFAIFADPVVEPDNPLANSTCPEGYVWDGPAPNSPCFAPMRGNTRIVEFDNGTKVVVAPIGRWVCIFWGRLAGCRTQEDALAGKMVFTDNTPYDGDHVDHFYVLQLVPNWVSSIDVGKTTIPVRKNIAFGEVPESAVPYMQAADRGKLRRTFAPRIPAMAKRLRIFRMPLARPRKLDVVDQRRLALYEAGGWTGAIAKLARRFGGSDYVAVPGVRGFDIVDLDVLDRLEAQGMLPPPAPLNNGGYYEAAVKGKYLTASYGHDDTWRFVHLLPDRIRSEEVAGELYVPIDGLVFGSFAGEINGADGLREIQRNIDRWNAKRRRG